MSEYNLIPTRIIEALKRYEKDRTATGSFLRAVLESDLTGALQYADDECIIVLKDIVSYCYNELPSPCWGSRNKVRSWLKGKTG